LGWVGQGGSLGGQKKLKKTDTASKNPQSALQPPHSSHMNSHTQNRHHNRNHPPPPPTPPGVALPPPDYAALHGAIRRQCADRNLQATDYFMLKAMQLYEMVVVRHGLMLVGDAMRCVVMVGCVRVGEEVCLVAFWCVVGVPGGVDVGDFEQLTLSLSAENILCRLQGATISQNIPFALTPHHQTEKPSRRHHPPAARPRPCSAWRGRWVI